MTWLRMDTDMRDHKVIGDLASALNVPLPHALGLYAGCLFGFGEHFPEAYPVRVADSLIEKWASWGGKRGRFADAFRRLCIETEAGRKDPPGRIRGWWRQEALLRKQEIDRQKPAGTSRIPRNSPQIPPEIPRGNLGCNEDGHDNDNGLSYESAAENSDSAPEVSPIGYRQQCTAACNRGLRENPNLPGFNELVSSNQDVTDTWRDAGIPVHVAARAIYWRAIAYKPQPTRRQPTSLRYFRQAVEEAWQLEQSGMAEGKLDPGAAPSRPGASATVTVDEGEFARAGRELMQRRERAEAAAAAANGGAPA